MYNIIESVTNGVLYLIFIIIDNGWDKYFGDISVPSKLIVGMFIYEKNFAPG